VKLKSESSSFPTFRSQNRGFTTNSSTKEGFPAGHIVESFVSILTDAVDTLQTRVAESYGKKESGTHKARMPTEAQPRQREREKSKNDDELNQVFKRKIDLDHESKRKIPGKETKVSENEERLFIHDRHTCDQCLCTPIIGPRYHSTNLPDYDLCAKCIDSYKGDQVQFEEEKLERDRSLQERWQRKRARRAGRGGSCRHHNRRGRQNFSNNRPEGTDPDMGEYPDLREAIRLSLQNIPTKQDSSNPIIPAENEVEESDSENSNNAAETAQVTNEAEAEKVNKEPNKALDHTAEGESHHGELNPPTPAPEEEEIVLDEQSSTPVCTPVCTQPVNENMTPTSHRKGSEESLLPGVCAAEKEEIISNFEKSDKLVCTQDPLGNFTVNKSFTVKKSVDDESSDFNKEIASYSHNANSEQTIRSKVTGSTEEKINGCIKDGSSFNVSNNPTSQEARLQQAVEAGHVLLTVAVPNTDVGLIIGKAGSTIKSIQDRSGASIQIPQPGDADNPAIRTVSITHPHGEGAQLAKTLIQDILGSKRNQVPHVTIQVDIPDKDVAMCVGRCGCVIHEMQNQTGTKIQIPSVSTPDQPSRIATVFGPPDGCAHVKQMIERIVLEQSSQSVMSGQQQQHLDAFSQLIGQGREGDLRDSLVDKSGNTLKSSVDEVVNAEGGATSEHLDQEKVGSESVSNASEDEWQVVAEDEQTENDEMIARAAQMLGSALFESDLLHSENISSMSNSESLSVPSSVPTTLLLGESEISSAVLQRWGHHLFQLHEIGFFDDKKSTEILERLTAANIGVDSDDEVSVTQVVNELLRN